MPAFCTCIGSNLVTWSGTWWHDLALKLSIEQHQSLVSGSIEVEYRAMALIAYEINCVKSLVKELGFLLISL